VPGKYIAGAALDRPALDHTNLVSSIQMAPGMTVTFATNKNLSA
jgi:hypothetical protein